MQFKIIENDQSENRKPRDPWIMHRYIILNDKDQEIAYLNTTYVPKENIDKYLPTPWHFLREIEGHCWFDPNNLSNILEEGKDRRIFPKDADKKYLSKYLKSTNAILRFERFKEFHVDNPLVDYIRVLDAELYGHRLGLILYKRMTRWLAKTKNMVLFASGIQSKEAQQCWKIMEDTGFPVKRIFLPKSEIERKYLDYR